MSYKKLICWINWFNREKIVFLIASLTLLLGAIYPWYRLPPPALETFGTYLFVANVGRALAALFALLCFASIFCFSLNRGLRLSCWSGLIAVLLFPYFITTWSPTIAFMSAAYYKQGLEVSSHVQANFPKVQSQWKQNISLTPSLPTQSIAYFSIRDSRFFQMSSWDRIWLEGFGYSNNFFGSIGRGWGFTVTGFVISLMALYLGLKKHIFNTFLIDTGKLFPWIGLVIGILVFSMILPNIINHQLDTMLAKGQYHQVLAVSKTLESWYPPLQGDQEFLYQRAKAGFYGGEPDPALIYFAKGLESYQRQDFIRAEDYFQRSLNIQPKRFLVREYLATTVLNQGVKYFNAPNGHNNRQGGAAADRFEQTLRIFPNHIGALYDLMLARVVNGEFEKSALVAKQIIETQQYPQQPNLALLGQAYLHLAWASYHNGDTQQAWKQYRQSIDEKTWKQSGEAQ